MIDPIENNEVGSSVRTKLNSLIETLNYEEKTDVRVVQDSNVNLAVFPIVGSVVDGVAVALGDRVLIVGQNNPHTNGIYEVTAVDPARATDADEDAEFTRGFIVNVTAGTKYKGTCWQFLSQVPFTVDSVSFPARFGMVVPPV